MPVNQIDLDGTFGEGGGQILRTALALSCVTGRAFRITNIRGHRPKPGLRKQHLVAVQAAQQICGAEVSGTALGSMELAFAPGAVRPGRYRFDITSAGSTTLVAQTLLPALFLAAEPSQLTITGGTHNPLAPPFDFVAEVFLPAIALMGFHAEAALQRHGFYPAGGGQISLALGPRQLQERSHTGAPAATPLDLTAPPGEVEWTGRIYDSMLPPQVVEAERSLLRQAIPRVGRIEHVRVTDSPGPGNCIMLVGQWRTGPGHSSSEDNRVGAEHPYAFSDCRGTPCGCPENGELNKGAGGDKPRPYERNGASQLSLSTYAPPPCARTILTAFGERGKPARAVVEELRDQLARFGAAAAPVDEHLADQLLVYLALCRSGRFATGRLSLHATTNMAVIEKFLPVKFSSAALPAGHVVSCLPM